MSKVEIKTKISERETLINGIISESETKKEQIFYFATEGEGSEKYAEILSMYEVKKRSNNTLGIITERFGNNYCITKVSYEETFEETMSDVPGVLTTSRYDITITYDGDAKFN